MQDLIDRTKLRKEIVERSISLLGEWDTACVLLLIESAPTIDPVKHGRLEPCGWDKLFCEWGKCTVCGFENPTGSNYCNGCGAKLDANE